MAKLILGAYSAEAIASLILFILAFPVLIKLHIERNYGSTFLMTMGVVCLSFGEFIRRLWWMTWKANYISRDASVWMLNHEIVLVSSFFAVLGLMMMGKAISRETKYSVPWRIVGLVLLCVMLMGYLIK